jgi:hypothetical protein
VGVVSHVRWRSGCGVSCKVEERVWCLICGGMGMVSMGFDSVALNSIATLKSFFGYVSLTCKRITWVLISNYVYITSL